MLVYKSIMWFIAFKKKLNKISKIILKQKEKIKINLILILILFLILLINQYVLPIYSLADIFEFSCEKENKSLY